MISPIRSGQPQRLDWEKSCWLVATGLVLWALVHRLGEIPEGCFQDEVSIGFNARALLRTGADQYGVAWPLYFRSFGDWKNPIAIYSTMLSTALFGNTAVALRSPGIVYALGTAVAVGFCVFSLTRRKALARWLGLISLLVPCLFFYARSGTLEPASFPFFLLLSVAGVLWCLEAPTLRRAALAGTFLGLAVYSYTAARLLMPLTVVAAVVALAATAAGRRTLWPLPVCAAVMAIPLAAFLRTHPHALFARFDSMSIFKPGASPNGVTRHFVKNYLSHWGPDFLFRIGQPGHGHWHNIGTGFLSLWMAVPLVLGLFACWERRREPAVLFLFALLLLSPIPASLTTDDIPHPNRALHLAPLFLLICALGIAAWLERAKPRRALVGFVLAATLLEGALMVRQYFRAFPVVYEQDNPGGIDHGMSHALLLTCGQRAENTPLFLPSSFFSLGGIYIDFWCNLDPRQVRQKGLDGLGFHSLKEFQRPADVPTGAFWVTEGTTGPPFPAVRVDEIDRQFTSGGPLWTVYQKL